MGQLVLTGNARTRSRLAELPAAGGASYLSLLTGQGATNYWALQTARNDTDTEPDLIGSTGMVMTSGNVPALSAGDGPLGGSVAATDKGVTFVAADTEFMVASGLSFNTRQNWSVSGWWRAASSLTGFPVPFQLDNTDGTHYVFLIHNGDGSSNGMCLQIGDGGSAKFLNTSTNIGNGAWRHIAFTRAYSATAGSDVWTLWIDGSIGSQKTATTLGITPNNTSNAAPKWSINALDSNALNLGSDVAHVAVAVGTTWGTTEISAQWAART